MTDAEKFVRERWPRAFVRPCGPTHKEHFLIYKAEIASVCCGQGATEIAAWADAANKLFIAGGKFVQRT